MCHEWPLYIPFSSQGSSKPHQFWQRNSTMFCFTCIEANHNNPRSLDFFDNSPTRRQPATLPTANFQLLQHSFLYHKRTPTHTPHIQSRFLLFGITFFTIQLAIPILPYHLPFTIIVTIHPSLSCNPSSYHYHVNYTESTITTISILPIEVACCAILAACCQQLPLIMSMHVPPITSYLCINLTV